MVTMPEGEAVATAGTDGTTWSGLGPVAFALFLVGVALSAIGLWGLWGLWGEPAVVGFVSVLLGGILGSIAAGRKHTRRDRAFGTTAAIGCFGYLILGVVATFIAISALVNVSTDLSQPPSSDLQGGPLFTSTTVSISTTTSCPTGGALEAATDGRGGIRAVGWADGCGATGPIQLYVDLDGQRVAGSFPANDARSGSHNSHGYDFTIPSTPGRHYFCVSANWAGADHLLRCTWVTVS